MFSGSVSIATGLSTLALSGQMFGSPASVSSARVESTMIQVTVLGFLPEKRVSLSPCLPSIRFGLSSSGHRCGFVPIVEVGTMGERKLSGFTPRPLDNAMPQSAATASADHAGVTADDAGR